MGIKELLGKMFHKPTSIMDEFSKRIKEKNEKTIRLAESHRLTSIVEEFEINGRKYVVVRIDGSRIIGDYLAKELGDILFKYLDLNSKKDYCIDFSKVEYLSTGALVKLIAMDKEHRKEREGRSVCLCGMSPDTYEVFENTKLNKLFPIYTSLNEYKAEIQKRAGFETVV